MKSYGRLFYRLLDTNVLLHAFLKARQGRSGQADVRGFQKRLHERITDLRKKLAHGTLGFGPYHGFWIMDPKPQLIQAAPFAQRVVHHAMIEVTGPAFERSLIEHSYACRKGKGHHAAIRQARSYARGNAWYLKMDVEN